MCTPTAWALSFSNHLLQLSKDCSLVTSYTRHRTLGCSHCTARKGTLSALMKLTWSSQAVSMVNTAAKMKIKSLTPRNPMPWLRFHISVEPTKSLILGEVVLLSSLVLSVQFCPFICNSSGTHLIPREADFSCWISTKLILGKKVKRFSSSWRSLTSF